MKKLLATAVAMTAISFGAAAADLPGRKTAPDAPVVAAPIFTWTGLYVGGHIGGAWGREADTLHVFLADAFNVSGVIGGVHAGYNWQMNQLVLGVEADLDASGVKGSRATTGAVGTLALSNSWRTSLRLRAGYAIDATLLYLTGGLAIADARETLTLGVLSASKTSTVTGWTLGGGVEHAFTPHWTGRIEARYSDFGSARNALNGNAFTSSFHDVSALVGAGYKF